MQSIWLIWPDWSSNFLPLILAGAVMGWLHLKGRPYQPEDLWGWLAVATAIASPMLSRLFLLPDGPIPEVVLAERRILWQAGLCGVLLMYTGLLAMKTKRFAPLGGAIGAAVVIATIWLVSPEAAVSLRHLITLALMLAIVEAVFAMFATFDERDVFGRSMWACRCGGEAFAVIEFLAPYLLSDEDQAVLTKNLWEVSPFFVERVFPAWSAHYAISLTFGIMLWVAFRFVQAGKRG